jgi:hypothetical protein
MSDQPVRFNPVGNMDKDSDPRYVRQGNYIDAKNIQKLTEKGGTGGAVIPVKGNELAFTLGEVEAQNKKYRINEGETVSYEIGEIAFLNKSGYLRFLSVTIPNLPYVNSLLVGGTLIIDGATPSFNPNLNITWTILSINGNTIYLVVPLNIIPAITVTPSVSGATITSGNYEITFLTMNQNHVMDTFQTAGDAASIYASLTDLNVFYYANQFTFTLGADYVDVEFNGFNYYDYYIQSTGNDRLDIFATQEAIPLNLTGGLIANGSYDILGHLFITSTTIEKEPEELNLNVIAVGPVIGTTFGAPTLITFSSNHDFQVGEWVGISNSNASWLNGTFLVSGIPTPNQIEIITDTSFGGVHGNVGYVVGDEVMLRNPQSIGEIGVALYDYDADAWSYTRLLRSIQLNFLTIHGNDITGRDDVRRKTLYYTDDYNNRRAFYYYGEYIEDGALAYINPNNYYSYDNIDQQNEVSSNSIEATVRLSEQIQGGALKAGNKRYFCYLVDYFGNRSAYSEISNVVSAYYGVPSGTIYGNEPEATVGKTNRLIIEQIDTDKYEYIALGFIDYVGEVVTASVLAERTISSRTMILDHTGSEETFITDIATITVSNLNVPKRALNVDLIDNRLVFSNLQEDPKLDLRPWSKTFKHRIKQKWITETSKYQLGEYQDVQVIHDNLGYMMNETYRFGVQVYWKKSGTWSEASWIDDIRVDPNPTNISNPQGDDRRIQSSPISPDELSNYDLNESIASGDFFNVLPTGIDSGYPDLTEKQIMFGRVKVPYVEFSGFDLNFEIGGTPIRNLISKIKIVRAECIPEVIASGPIVMSVGMGSSKSNDNQITTGNYLNLEGVTSPMVNTLIGTTFAAKTELNNPTFPLSYGYVDGDIYYPIAPSVCLTENDNDTFFDWRDFEGTFHEYPFAYGSPMQGGIRPFDIWTQIDLSPRPDNDLPFSEANKYLYYIDNAYAGAYNLDIAFNTPQVSNNMRRVFYSDSVSVGNAGNGFYWDITNYGYPDFSWRNGAEHQRITPLYHYGEDSNPQGSTGGFSGKHGQPFGTKVRLANSAASQDIAQILSFFGDLLNIATFGAIGFDIGHLAMGYLPDVILNEAGWNYGQVFAGNVRKYYPFWVNRRILTFYAPDLLLDNKAIPTAGTLNVFGEYRMDRRHHNDIACGLFSSTLPLSGYSEYTVENMGTDYVQYDINDIFDIGDGGSDEIYSGASFRKSYSANTKNWASASRLSGDNAMKAEYTKHNNLYVNPRSLVLRVDGNTDPSLRDGLTGVEAPNKNTDYGVYYVQMYQASPGKYGGTGDSTYIDTGYSVRVGDLSDTNGIVNQNQINVFGGDTFTQATYLATRRTNPSEIPDGGPGEEYEGGLPGFGGGMKFYSQNRVNSQLRTDDTDSFLYPKDTTSQRDWLEDYLFGHGNNFRYNQSYTPKSGVLSYSSINDRLIDQQVDLPSRIDYSEKYEQNTLDDKNQSFLPLNFKDIDQAFGEIISHKNVNGELFTLQPRKFQAQFFNASGTLQTESTEGLNVVIGDGAVLARDGRTLSSYGTEHKWSVIKGKSPGGKDVLYWYNQESKLIMRFGADGTVVLSDVHGLRSFLENDARWVQGKDTPYAGDGVRVVWDDEYKEAIWTWRGVRKVAKYVGGRTIVVGAIVENTNAPSDTFDNIPRLFRCTVEHNSTPNYEPGVGSDWEQVWEQIDYDNEEYYTWFTLAFNEMTNGFSSFYSHHPKIYLPWRNKFLSAHPTEENKIYEHRRGEYTTWYNSESGELSEDAYIEGVVNYMPESSKKFVATQVISDNEPDRMEFETKRHKTWLEKGEFDDHDDHWRSPIKNDASVSNDPDGDTESLTGDYVKVKFFIKKKLYNRLYNFVIKVRERLRVYRK